MGATQDHRDGPHVGRRRSIALVIGAIGTVAGCIGTERTAEEENDMDGRLSVEIRSEIDRSFRAEVALVEGTQPFEAGRLAQMNFATKGDIQGIAKPDISGGPFRVLIRLVENQRDYEVDQPWDLEECIEFSTRVTVLETEVAVSTACTLADGG